MRTFLLSLLLATTAATPALAQRADREDRAESREERRAKAEARKEKADREAARAARETTRPQRVERAPQVERNAEARDRAITVRERQTEGRAANVNERGRPILDERRQARETLVAPRQQQRQEARQERVDSRGEARQQRVDSREEARQQRVDSRERLVEQVTRPSRVTPPPSARPDRPAPPPPTATTSNSRAPNWHTTWRNDHRYDWRRHRDRNRSLFRLGFYFDPFGWSYRRYGIGWRLWPSYYSSYYWLNDPWTYRLPYAPWPYRWVRYYDDALLVNTMTGQVVDVMYDFFW